jgi:drug/metabolite transporter (DMT)-like permease
MQFNKSYFKLHFLVILWGFTAILGLLIKLSFIEVVFYRTLFSFLALAVILQINRIGFSIAPREVMKLLLTGVIIAFHWLLFFGSARYSNASVSLIGLSTTTFWTSLVEPIVHKRRISIIEILFGLVVVVGIYIIYIDDFTYGLGLIMSLGSAVLAAIFSVLNYAFVRKHDPLTITFYEMVGAWLGTLPFLWLLNESGGLLSLPSWPDMGYLLILALVCTVYANSQLTRLLKQFSAFACNLVINMEPIYGILLALMFFGASEKMNTGFYLGALFIITAIFLYPVILRRFQQRKQQF